MSKPESESIIETSSQKIPPLIDANVSGVSEQRRRELAEFLRSRRERLKPDQVGITQLARRRTPGLRREEVAELAGVGTTWYTWLEQARDIQPSGEVLRRLAAALLMTSAEIRHLYALAGKAAPTDESMKSEQPSEGLLRLLNHSIQAPAILLGTRWDVVGINAHADRAFPSLMKLAREQGNWMRFILLSKPSREQIGSWEMNARRLIGEFRSSLSDMLDHPWTEELVESLKTESPEFSKWWREHDVRDNTPTIVEVIDGESQQAKRYERMLIHASENGRFKMMVFNSIP